ncbi:MAG: hypothetical protein H7Z40_04910 [Phycisphaerae bacterium]|nr:hypothetical protein [Gemmatimonadaceae bacterium]
MAPSFRQKLRAMSTILSIFLAVAVAGTAAWMVRRLDLGRDAPITECSRLVTEAFTNARDTPDSLLLARLLPLRDRCLDDAGYVDQTRRLLTNATRFTEARTLLKAADEKHAFKPDELVAQFAWIDAAESHDAWANGEEGRATELLKRATDATNGLRARWPEWSLPYRILDEANLSGASPTNDGGGTSFFQMEREARSRKLNGAWVRAQSDWQPVALTFAVAFVGMLALIAGIGGLLDARQISSVITSQAATATPGYVELKGTVHVPAGAHGVIGPHTKQYGVWSEFESKSGMKKSVVHRQRSQQKFVLRDATGDVLIDPTSMSVNLRTSTARFGNSAGQLNGTRVTERLLKEGDAAYALGELSVMTSSDGVVTRHLRAAKDGRRLFVSNYTEEELVSMERVWMGLGGAVAVSCVLLLAWGYFQRFHVASTPGSLL